MSTGNEAPATWLSQDAYDRLEAELDEHIANRPAIAAEINARREEGDLRENGGYHAAREEQGKAEVASATCRNCCAPQGRRGPDGRRGVARHGRDDLLRRRRRRHRDLPARLAEIAATTDLTVYSPESALGKAILGGRSGQTCTYTAPSGADIKVTVVSFEPFSG